MRQLLKQPRQQSRRVDEAVAPKSQTVGLLLPMSYLYPMRKLQILTSRGFFFQHVTADNVFPQFSVPHYMGCMTSCWWPHRLTYSSDHTLIYMLIHGFTILKRTTTSNKKTALAGSLNASLTRNMKMIFRFLN